MVKAYAEIQDAFYKRLKEVNEKIREEKDEDKKRILEGEMHLIDAMFIKGFRPDRPMCRLWETYESYVKDFNREAHDWYLKNVKEV